MYNPLIMTMKIQAATMATGMSIAGIMFAQAMRMLRQERTLLGLGPAAHRRTQDNAAAAKPSPPTEADLLDHYGKRHTDVDVEHMR